MIAKLLLFFISFVLAGSHLPRPSSKILATFNEKIASGDIAALQLLLDSNPYFIKSPFAKQYREDGFIKAVQQGRAPVVEILLKNGNVNAATRNNKAIRQASDDGYLDIVRILLDRPEVNPSAMENKALIKATRKGHTEVVRLLLAHPKLNPAARISKAVFLATSRNRGDIVKLFINDERFYTSIFQVPTLSRAAHFGNVDLVRFLLGYPFFSNLVVFVAAKGDLTTVKTLVHAGYIFDRESLDSILLNARLSRSFDIIEYVESLIEYTKLPERPLISMTEQCAICLSDENLLKGYMTSCNHQFHVECLQQWIARQNSCPMCRSPLI
jgi:hypothetical protein